MHRKLLLALLLLLPAGYAANTLCAPPVQAAQARSARQLMDAFRQAHQKRDLTAMRRLVYWQGVDASGKKLFDTSATMDFGQRIKRITIEPLPAGQKLEYTLRGVTFRPNLKPVGRMKVEFSPPPGSSVGKMVVTSSSYLVGVKDGAHFIVLAAPVRR